MGIKTAKILLMLVLSCILMKIVVSSRPKSPATEE